MIGIRNSPRVKILKATFVENQIRLLSKSEEIPYNLLLLADETKEAIERYIHVSDVFILEIAGVVSGVYALYSEDNVEIEIKNIAVITDLQGIGIGSFLLNDAIRRSKEAGYKTIIVGTPESSNILLQFYEKSGFKKYDKRINFYSDNYPEPIIENGVQLRDMILLKKKL